MTKIILFATITGMALSFQANAQCCKPKENEATKVKQLLGQEGKVLKLRITGMTCTGCANHVHKVLSEAVGVLDNSVEYPGDIAVIRYDPEKTQPESIIETIEQNTNYKARLYKEKPESKS